MTGSEFHRGNFNECDLDTIDITDSSFYHVGLMDLTAVNQNFSGMTFNYCNFHQTILSGSSFYQADITGSLFPDTFLDWTDFRYAQSEKCVFANAVVEDAHFEKANIPQGIFEK